MDEISSEVRITYHKTLQEISQDNCVTRDIKKIAALAASIEWIKSTQMRGVCKAFGKGMR